MESHVKNLLLSLGIASTLLIAACGKKEEQTAPAPEAQTAPPAAAPAPTSTAPATAPADQPADQTTEKPAEQPKN
jgi:hypothetical protein